MQQFRDVRGPWKGVQCHARVAVSIAQYVYSHDLQLYVVRDHNVVTFAYY